MVTNISILSVMVVKNGLVIKKKNAFSKMFSFSRGMRIIEVKDYET